VLKRVQVGEIIVCKIKYLEYIGFVEASVVWKEYREDWSRFKIMLGTGEEIYEKGEGIFYDNDLRKVMSLEIAARTR
jgi:hypothetical protein